MLSCYPKYFSRAKENKNKKTEINRDGISVNNEKKIIYFLLAIEPLTLILFLIEFFTKKIIIKKANNKKYLQIIDILNFGQLI